MIQHKIEITVNRSVEEVFRFLTEAKNLPEWESGLIEVEKLTEGNWKVGTRLREVRRLNGRTSESIAEIIHFEQDKRFDVKSLTKPEVTGSFSVKLQNSGTKLCFNFKMQTVGFMRLFEFIIFPLIKKQINKDFQKLKEILEKN
jgi:uncharacterized membrane protein